jgi:hypothetical protein
VRRHAFVALMASCCVVFAGVPCMAFDLNYDHLVPLDAEALAETGIKSAYQELIPALKKHIASPAPITEQIDSDAPSYSVVCQGVTYHIYGPGDHEQSWGKAAFALFDIVNRQLANTRYRLFAISGGHELGGILLTVEEAQAARKSIKARSDWPYLPASEAPWYGMYHEGEPK